MRRILLYAGLALVLFTLLFQIYKTRSYKGPTQIVLDVAGVLLLFVILYTCPSEH